MERSKDNVIKQPELWLEYISKIQDALKPLNYEVYGFDVGNSPFIELKLLQVIKD